MRTEKRNAFLSGLCVVAVALGMMATSAYGDASTERGASILAFPKVLADTSSDTIIQITNISNNMVHARCFYVNAVTDPVSHVPVWQVTDFVIWLTKQQPTQWKVSEGRFIDQSDTCYTNSNGQYIPSQNCSNAGIDPGAVPPVPSNFVGELKCVEVDISDNPIGGNHLKGEATIKTDGDVSKYNAIGLQGTSLAGQTGNVLQLNQPLDATSDVGEYDACPNALLMNNFAEGVTDPVILAAGLGGTCETGGKPCQSDADCTGTGNLCQNPPQILDPATGLISLRSSIVTDLTLIPCTEDFENNQPFAVTVQFQIFNEFEQPFSRSLTVDCWLNTFLFQIDSPNDPQRSVFSYNVLGTTVAHTRIIPNADSGAVLGVVGVTRADAQMNLARVADNLHMEGDRFTGTMGQGYTDQITLSDE